MMRVCIALDFTPKQLARNAGVPFKELKPLLNLPANTMPDPQYDEVWWAVSEYVAKHIGLLMAVRAEMNKLMQKSRAKKIARAEQFRSTHDRR
jgi:hypothetical protein